MSDTTGDTTHVKVVSNLDDVDWSRTGFPLGVALPGGGEQWCALDTDDLKILRLLLDTTPAKNGVSVAAASSGLAALSKWIDSALRYGEIRPKSK